MRHLFHLWTAGFFAKNLALARKWRFCTHQPPTRSGSSACHSGIQGMPPKDTFLGEFCTWFCWSRKLTKRSTYNAYLTTLRCKTGDTGFTNNNVLQYQFPFCAKFHQNRLKTATVGERTDRQTDTYPHTYPWTYMYVRTRGHQVIL